MLGGGGREGGEGKVCGVAMCKSERHYQARFMKGGFGLLPYVVSLHVLHARQSKSKISKPRLLAANNVYKPCQGVRDTKARQWCTV